MKNIPCVFLLCSILHFQAGEGTSNITLNTSNTTLNQVEATVTANISGRLDSATESSTTPAPTTAKTMASGRATTRPKRKPMRRRRPTRRPNMQRPKTTRNPNNPTPQFWIDYLNYSRKRGISTRKPNPFPTCYGFCVRNSYTRAYMPRICDTAYNNAWYIGMCIWCRYIDRCKSAYIHQIF